MKRYYLLNKTPLRVSLFGGGTDFENYFRSNHTSTISFTINKFIYTTLKNHNHENITNENIRLNYSKTEKLIKFNNIKNNIIRETFKHFKFEKPSYLSTISDIPEGTGLGSSSAFVVGMPKLMSSFKKKKLTNYEVAKIASYIEIDKIKSPIGYQDQYIASFGGFKKINYSKKGIKVQSLKKHEKTLKKILNHSLFIWLSKTRKANKILATQKKNIKINVKHLDKINNYQKLFYKSLYKKFSVENFGNLMRKSWESKKETNKKIVNKKIRNLEKILDSNSCLGYKILGAGGGGFMLAVFNAKEKKKFIKKYKNKLKFLNIEYYPYGSQNILEEVF